MEYRKYVGFLVMLCSLQAVAQQKEKILKGYLGVEGGESFVYKLVFTDSLGYINGYSYTWLYEQSEVKATITGWLDKKNKTLSFKEDLIVYNKGFQSNTTICLINAVLKYKQGEGTTVFSGSITSSDITNVSCGRGTITFQDNDVLRSLFNEASPTPAEQPGKEIAKAQKPIRIIYDTTSAPKISKVPSVAYEPGIVKITQGVEKVYEWTTDTVIVDLWDGSRIDGDVITVLYNKDRVLQSYPVVRQPKRIKLPLSGAPIDIITIVTENEGNESLSTTNILLTDGKVQYALEAYNSIGNKALIKIKKASGQKK